MRTRMMARGPVPQALRPAPLLEAFFPPPAGLSTIGAGDNRGGVRGRHSPQHGKPMPRPKPSVMTGTAELNATIERVAPDILGLLGGRRAPVQGRDRRGAGRAAR